MITVLILAFYYCWNESEREDKVWKNSLKYTEKLNSFARRPFMCLHRINCCNLFLYRYKCFMWSWNSFHTLCYQRGGLGRDLSIVHLCYPLFIHWNSPTFLLGQPTRAWNLSRYWPSCFWYLGSYCYFSTYSFYCLHWFLFLIVLWRIPSIRNFLLVYWKTWVGGHD